MVDLSQKRCYPVAWGLIHCVWYAPKEWTAEQISDDVTARDPPGTSHNRWEVSEPMERKDAFNNTNNRPCPDDPNRLHWLMNC